MFSKNKKAIMAFMLATMMAAPTVGGNAVYAAEDVDQEVYVNATSEDQEVEVGSITPTHGDGILVEAEKHSATVTSDDINANDGEGIYIRANDEAEVTVTTGDVSASSCGINCSLYNQSNATIETKNITSDHNGVNSFVNDSELTLTTGDITASRYGIELIEEDGGVANVVVNGDIKVEGNFVIDGEKAESAGIGFGSFSENDKADIIVDGTISGGDAGVLLDPGTFDPGENLNLTVWKIELNETGNVAEQLYVSQEVKDYYASDGMYIKDVDVKAFEKRIMYIIKHDQLTEGGTISFSDANGNALKMSHGYLVANEGDIVLLKTDMQEGYKISGAYSVADGNKLELLRNDNGDYYTIVPKGGGVYITATAEKEKFDLCFYDEDGNLIQKDNVEYGSYITIPNAPYREGYDFVCWVGSKYYPGDKYYVTGPHTFRALWEKKEDLSDDTPANVSTSVNNIKTKAASPATGDTSNIVILFIVMMLSGAGAVISTSLKIRLGREE